MNRRTFLSSLLLATALPVLPAFAAGAEVYDVTPELIAAAKSEGVVVFYTSVDVALAEKLASAFETKYPGVKVKVERSGAERVFQRIGQEYGSNIRNVDVAETSDAVHFAIFKKNGWLTQLQPAEVAKLWPENARDADGSFAAFRAHLSVIAYNTKQVKAEDAPKSYADLLLPKWKGRMVNPKAIRRTALFTVEGERDDICAIGQTVAAHDLCSSLRPYRKKHYMQAGVGHYGVFAGRRWAGQIYPLVRNTILANE